MAGEPLQSDDRHAVALIKRSPHKRQALLVFTADAYEHLLTPTQNEAADRMEELNI